MPWVIIMVISLTILAWLGRRTSADDHGGYRGNRCGGVQVGQVALVSDLEADVLDGSEALADSGADGDGGSVQVVVGVCASLHEFLEQPAVPANQREQTVDKAFGEVLN